MLAFFKCLFYFLYLPRSDASEIAPTAKKPQRSMDAGDRERDLGSLREAEMLYRRAKKLGLNIIEHWNPQGNDERCVEILNTS